MRSTILLTFLVCLQQRSSSAFSSTTFITLPTCRASSTGSSFLRSSAPSDVEMVTEDTTETADMGDSSIFMDEEAMLKAKNFPLKSPELIKLAKGFLMSEGGFGADPALLANNFQFVGPVVGPLGKDEFLGAIGSVDMKTAFPDFSGEFYNFQVDPFEGDRVWYIARGSGTNTGPLPPFAPTATNVKVTNPPQACSLTFNKDGLVSKYTIGYVIDRDVGNTGGLGGLYGILYAIGRPLPFPEAQPWKKSKRYAIFNALGGLLQKLSN